MILLLDVLSNWVSLEDSNHPRHRLHKHLLVFLAVLVGAGTSGSVHDVRMQRTTSDRELERPKRSAAMGNTTEISSIPSSADSILIESFFRSGFYSATFDRICQEQTSRNLVTGFSGSRADELTSEDRPHSTEVKSSFGPLGGALVRVRRASVRRSCEKRRSSEILKSSDCSKIEARNAVTNNSCLMAARRDMDDVDRACAEDEERSLGCYPIPQVVHLTDLCHELPLDVGANDMRTIIHACPDVACCDKRHRCQVKHHAKVDKSFMVGDDKAITISFRNQTECACAPPGLKSTFSKPVRPTPGKGRRIPSPSVHQSLRRST